MWFQKVSTRGKERYKRRNRRELLSFLTHLRCSAVGGGITRDDCFHVRIGKDRPQAHPFDFLINLYNQIRSQQFGALLQTLAFRGNDARKTFDPTTQTDSLTLVSAGSLWSTCLCCSGLSRTWSGAHTQDLIWTRVWILLLGLGSHSRRTAAHRAQAEGQPHQPMGSGTLARALLGCLAVCLSAVYGGPTGDDPYQASRFSGVDQREAQRMRRRGQETLRG